MSDKNSILTVALVCFFSLFFSLSFSLSRAQLKRKPEHLARDFGDMVLGPDTFAQVYPEVREPCTTSEFPVCYVFSC